MATYTDTQGTVWLDLAGVAQTLTVHRSTATSWVRRPGFPAVFKPNPDGQVRRWRLDDVIAWRDAQMVEMAATVPRVRERPAPKTRGPMPRHGKKAS